MRFQHDSIERGMLRTAPKRRLPIWAGLSVALLFAAGAAQAGLPGFGAPDSAVGAAQMLEAARVPSCVGEEERLELTRYRDLVAASASVETAREKAIFPSKLARRALTLAGLVQRDDSELDRVRARLVEYEARVARAETPQHAAAEFDGLVRVAGANVNVGGGGGGGCSYSTSEIIAIVFGFLLFIIPGIIMLILFC